jgi:predicted nucleic acid-binding protein
MTGATVVLDASYVLAIVMYDDAQPASADVVLAAHLIAPAIWPLEMAHAVMSSLRRKRLAAAHAPRLFGAMEQLDVEVFATPMATAGHWFTFATQHRLTPYDAQYIDLALQHHCAIATCDAAVAQAATKLGLTVLA